MRSALRKVRVPLGNWLQHHEFLGSRLPAHVVPYWQAEGPWGSREEQEHIRRRTASPAIIFSLFHVAGNAQNLEGSLVSRPRLISTRSLLDGLEERDDVTEAGEPSEASSRTSAESSTRMPSKEVNKSEWRQWINRRLEESSSGSSASPEETVAALQKDERGNEATGGNATSAAPTRATSASTSAPSSHLLELAASLNKRLSSGDSRERSRLPLASLLDLDSPRGSGQDAARSASDGAQGMPGRHFEFASDDVEDSLGLVKDFTEVDEEENFCNFNESDDNDFEGLFSEQSELVQQYRRLLDQAPTFDLDDEQNPYMYRPGKSFFPGQNYTVEDLDLSLPNTFDPLDEPKPRLFTSRDMLERADFRNVRFLSEFVTPTANIKLRSKTKLSAKAQRKLAREVKTARSLGLVPFTHMGKPPFKYANYEAQLAAYDDDGREWRYGAMPGVEPDGEIP